MGDNIDTIKFCDSQIDTWEIMNHSNWTPKQDDPKYKKGEASIWTLHLAKMFIARWFAY